MTPEQLDHALRLRRLFGAATKCHRCKSHLPWPEIVLWDGEDCTMPLCNGCSRYWKMGTMKSTQERFTITPCLAPRRGPKRKQTI